MDDRDKKTILARRRFFIATAVAGLAATQCDSPRPCLKVAMPPDAGVNAAETSVEAAPIPVALPREDIVDATDEQATEKPVPIPRPSVCLNPYE